MYNSDENESSFNVKNCVISSNFKKQTRLRNRSSSQKNCRSWSRRCTRSASACVEEAAACSIEMRDADRSLEYFWGISGIRVNIWPRHGASHHRGIHRKSGRVPDLPQRSKKSQFLLSRRMRPATWDIQLRNTVSSSIQNWLIIPS